MTKKVQKEKFSVKLIFNPDDPFDTELIKALKSRKKMSTFIKYALYHYISVVEKDGNSGEPDKLDRARPSVQKDVSVSTGKEKTVYQWDKDAAFADAFEPLK